MLTLTEFALRNNLSRTRIHQLLKAKRIPGAKIVGNSTGKGMWLIPKGAQIRRA